MYNPSAIIKSLTKRAPGKKYVVMNSSGKFLNYAPGRDDVFMSQLGCKPPALSRIWNPHFSNSSKPESFGACSERIAIYKAITGLDDLHIAEMTTAFKPVETPCEITLLHQITSLSQRFGVGVAKAILANSDKLDPEYHHYLSTVKTTGIRTRCPQAQVIGSYVFLGKGDMMIMRLIAPKAKIHDISEAYKIIASTNLA